MTEGTFPKGTGNLDLYASEVNSMARYFGVDLTGGSTSATTFTKVGEVAVAAGEIDNFVLVFSQIWGEAQYESGSGDRAEAQFDLKIGESGSEASKDTFQLGKAGNNYVKMTHTWYYQPTTAEKAAGFNIQVFMKADSDEISIDMGCDHIWVFGG